MAKRPRYTDEFRAGVVLMLEAAGYTGDKETSHEGSLSAVSAKTGVPLSTLRRWFIKQQNPPPAELVNKKRKELVVRLEEMAHMFIDAIFDDTTSNGVDAVRAATALGITIDKLQLLQGKPTDRTEHLTQQQRRDEIAELLETARARALASVADTGRNGSEPKATS